MLDNFWFDHQFSLKKWISIYLKLTKKTIIYYSIVILLKTKQNNILNKTIDKYCLVNEQHYGHYLY